MANKNRPSRSGGGAGKNRRSGGTGAKNIGAGAAPQPPKREAKPVEKPSRAGDYMVPGGLAVVLVITLFVYFRMRGHAPAEPTPTPETSSESPSSPSANAPGGTPSQPTGTTPHPVAPMPPAQPDQPAQDVTVTPVHPEPTTPDPLHGQFSLAQATQGMPPGNTLVADIQTSMGTFNCTLLPDRAPVNVANFVGLARGVRDFWDPVAGRWTRRPFFDGSVFHRVIPNFMIQGGDILRSGRGDPGYEVPDENTSGHDAPGLLCMANHGPNTGGAQFFITETAQAHLDGSYSIFGRCTPTDLVGRIARVPRNQRDTPLAPVYIQHVTIHR